MTISSLLCGACNGSVTIVEMENEKLNDGTTEVEHKVIANGLTSRFLMKDLPLTVPLYKHAAHSFRKVSVTAQSGLTNKTAGFVSVVYTYNFF